VRRGFAAPHTQTVNPFSAWRNIPNRKTNMNRLVVTLRHDARLQWRNGFYYATVFVTAFWVLILLQIGAFDLRWLLPPLVIGNLLIGTFLFIGGLVLLEKGEGSLSAQIVTPLRLSEYLGAKVITLTLLAFAETLVIVVLLAGWQFNIFLLTGGVFLTGAIYCLAGFIVVLRYTSINEYLLPSGMYMGLLWIPLLAYLAHWNHWLLYLHPLTAPLLLVEAAFEPVVVWQVVYGFVYASLWIVGLYVWSKRSFQRWMATG
jgi:fluoroquinolone transport system permease protein